MVSFDVFNEGYSPTSVLYDPETHRHFVTADGEDKVGSAEAVRVSTEYGIETWRCTIDENVAVDLIRICKTTPERNQHLYIESK